MLALQIVGEPDVVGERRIPVFAGAALFLHTDIIAPDLRFEVDKLVDRKRRMNVRHFQRQLIFRTEPVKTVDLRKDLVKVFLGLKQLNVALSELLAERESTLRVKVGRAYHRPYLLRRSGHFAAPREVIVVSTVESGICDAPRRVVHIGHERITLEHATLADDDEDDVWYAYRNYVLDWAMNASPDDSDPPPQPLGFIQWRAREMR